MSIDTLPQLLKTKHFEHQEIETKIREYWKEEQIYKINPTELQTGERPILIDTPPPYANGALHHGHGMSYSQLDIIARFNRMLHPTLLPLAFDDNGLPTERFTEKKYNIKPGQHPGNFFELCKQEAENGIRIQRDQFDKLGFSYNHKISYRTIDDRSIRISQLDFLHLFVKGHIIRQKEPQLYCTRCQTALAQADLDNQTRTSQMHYIRFPNADTSKEGLLIGTTRPELIPAAVAIFYHPDDSRRNYSNLRIINPLTGQDLPLLSDDRIDLDKGSGILMCATFGDQLDIELYREYQLPNRTIIDKNGLMTYSETSGMTTNEAKKIILQKLESNYFLSHSEHIKQQIPICERCSTPMEIIESYQWSLDILSIKDDLLNFIDQIQFHPTYMKKRLIHWISDLKWNWTISRQRFYGIPIPMFHCQKCQNIYPADDDQLPITPMDNSSKSCPNCGGEGKIESSILDTWFTSSLTPRILSDRYFGDQTHIPLSFRSQAHEIIRTWAFYTIVKQYLQGDEPKIPWDDLLISGWGLGFKQKGKRAIKASKSKGTGTDPSQLIKDYGADAFRYWAASAKLGKDQHLMEAILNRGKKLRTKIYNAAKITFIMLFQLETSNNDLNFNIEELEQSFSSLRETYLSRMKKFDYSDALSELENQFWELFCSNQIEEMKEIAYSDGLNQLEKDSLLQTWRGYLQLFAPFMPFITEYLWYLTDQFEFQHADNQENFDYKSIHNTKLFLDE